MLPPNLERSNKRRIYLAIAAGIGLCLASPAGRADFAGHGGMVRSVAVSADGSRLMTASFDYTARLWDFATQSELGTLDGHTAPVNAVAFLPDGRRALSAGDDGTLIVWDLETRKAVDRFEGHTAKIADLAVSAAGDLAATAGWDGSVRLWDLQKRAEVRRLDHGIAVNAVAFDPTGATVFSGDKDGVIRIWDRAGGTIIDTMPAHDMAVTDIAVSADGTRLLSAGIDGTVRLWDTGERRELTVLRGHDGPVFDVAFSPDSQSALSAGRDGRVILWSLQTGQAIRWIAAHEGPCWAVAFSRDGRFAVSAGSDETVRMWHLETGSRIGIAVESDDGEPRPWLVSSHPGAKLYRACANCHALDHNGVRRSGPHFEGLFGRRAGAVPGYPYSPALSGADFVWTKETLTALFRRGPDVMVPGSKMPLQRIANEQALRELVAYLAIITAPGYVTGESKDEEGKQP